MDTSEQYIKMYGTTAHPHAQEAIGIVARLIRRDKRWILS